MLYRTFAPLQSCLSIQYYKGNINRRVTHIHTYTYTPCRDILPCALSLSPMSNRRRLPLTLAQAQALALALALASLLKQIICEKVTRYALSRNIKRNLQRVVCV